MNSQRGVSQLLTATVIGIGMDAALKIGAARGSDLAVLSELLPAAEAGFIEALCSADADRPH
jgi:hypothetical protein